MYFCKLIILDLRDACPFSTTVVTGNDFLKSTISSKAFFNHLKRELFSPY